MDSHLEPLADDWDGDNPRTFISTQTEITSSNLIEVSRDMIDAGEGLVEIKSSEFMTKKKVFGHIYYVKDGKDTVDLLQNLMSSLAKDEELRKGLPVWADYKIYRADDEDYLMLAVSFSETRPTAIQIVEFSDILEEHIGGILSPWVYKEPSNERLLLAYLGCN